MESQTQLGVANYKKDAYIIVEGKQSDCFFIIQQGKVKIVKEVRMQGEMDEVLGPGDFFGVISTMSSHSQIESALALDDVVLIAVRQNQYAGLIQKNAPVAIKIILQFSKRLRYLNETLARLTFKNTADDGPSHLYDVAEYYLSQKQYYQAMYAYAQYVRRCPSGEKIASAKDKYTKLSNSIKLPVFTANDVNRTYRKNTMLFAEGEPGDELFIIQKGSIKITKIVDHKEVLLAMLKQGDILGEMALLEGKPRAASAVAYEDCDVMAVNKANFELMIKNQPQLIERITTLLADRIWLIYKQLANTMIDDPTGRMYDALLIQLEKNRVPLNSKTAYTFAFGKPELFNMVGIQEKKGSTLLTQMMEDKKLKIIDDKIYTTSTEEIFKQSEYFRKMDKIEKAQRESRAKNNPGV
ncbi:MAG: cyclic nucleotide-binding domain-containing protein [Treponema sp.]|jgi:CRP-like cAMP-binding protein|nr:cyclic nucleotide-binding domain-containing protein [Treponema sp.]